MSGHKVSLLWEPVALTVQSLRASLVEDNLIIQTQRCAALIEGDLSVCLQQTLAHVLFLLLLAPLSHSSTNQN